MNRKLIGGFIRIHSVKSFQISKYLLREKYFKMKIVGECHNEVQNFQVGNIS